MAFKPGYTYSMAELWMHPIYKNYYAMWRENGRTRRKALCAAGTTRATRDRRIAARLLNHFNRALIAGKIIPMSECVRRSFFLFCDEFQAHIESKCAPATCNLYEVALAKAKSSWGDIPLNHITVRHIDQFLSDLVRGGLAVPTANKNYRHVKAALNQAYKWEYLPKPIRFPAPLKERKKIRYLTVEDMQELIKCISDQEFADFCLFSAYTGLRSGEILRLKWSDIDNPQGYMRISELQKNGIESRIPINTHARAILDRQTKSSGKVFRFRCLTWVSQKFKEAAKKAGLENARFHDLRHTFGSHLAMAGAGIKAIQRLMRHEAIASTMVYVEVSPQHLEETSELLNYGPMPMVGKQKQKRKKT